MLSLWDLVSTGGVVLKFVEGNVFFRRAEGVGTEGMSFKLKNCKGCYGIGVSAQRPQEWKF